jgi:hypothetical protein
MRIGFTIYADAVQDTNALLSFVKEAQPAWLTLIQDKTGQLLSRLHNVSPNTNIMYVLDPLPYRETHPWNTVTPSDFAQRYITAHASTITFGANKDHLWYSVLYQPRFDKLDSRRMGQWLQEVVAILVEHNIKCVIGNLDMMYIEKWEVQQGYYDKLLATVSQHPDFVRLWSSRDNLCAISLWSRILGQMGYVGPC